MISEVKEFSTFLCMERCQSVLTEIILLICTFLGGSDSKEMSAM